MYQYHFHRHYQPLPPVGTEPPAYTDATGTSQPLGASDQAIWIGPEGGFSDEENQRLAQAASPLSIGPHILRIETATIAMLAAIHSLNGTLT